jgi:hypothetical protein
MRKIIVFLLVLAVSAVVARADCNNCSGLEAWFAQPPFEDSQTLFCPYTFGLQIGAAAPPIEGIEFQAANTVLVVINYSCDSEYWPLIGEWSSIPECQVVVVASDMGSSRLQELRTAVGERVKIIKDPLSAIVCALYQVGERASPVTFLVNREGTIVYRRRAFPNYAVPELERIVHDFAEHGTPPDDALLQQVLWYGDQVRWPSFPLYTPDGEEVSLEPGVPRVIYLGWTEGNSACVFRELSALQSEFPRVEFIWLRDYFSEAARTSIWEYGRRIGLDKVHPEFFAIPLEDYLARPGVRNWAEEREELRTLSSSPDFGWRILLDEDYRLITSWNLYGMRTVMILDADGTVVFPCTLYPINLVTGEPVCHPRAKVELARILSEISER